MSGQGWIVRAPGEIDRIEACFEGAAFAPHRHDTYAIGVTLSGVQSFDYRGQARHSLPGRVVVLHPDEAHDGRAGDERAFSYRTAYLAPSLMQTMLGGGALPFVAGGVSEDARLRMAVDALLGDCTRALEPLESESALFDLASALQAVAGTTRPAKIANAAAVTRAKDYIDARITQAISLADLERATEHDRWQLSRDFRAMFGTSPYRYLMLRRLDRARRMMIDGHTPADGAVACGFSDQSHLNRVLKSTFGMTPSAWLRAVAGAHDRSIPASRTSPN
jgi:AraC-like DNA-binding protein